MTQIHSTGKWFQKSALTAPVPKLSSKFKIPSLLATTANNSSLPCKSLAAHKMDFSDLEAKRGFHDGSS